MFSTENIKHLIPQWRPYTQKYQEDYRNYFSTACFKKYDIYIYQYETEAYAFYILAKYEKENWQEKGND